MLSSGGYKEEYCDCLWKLQGRAPNSLIANLGEGGLESKQILPRVRLPTQNWGWERALQLLSDSAAGCGLWVGSDSRP